MTALHAAAQVADVKTIHELLTAGADVNECDEFGFTPLHRAATAGEEVDSEQVIEALRLLLKHGAALEDVEPSGRTPLYLAIEFSQTAEPVQAIIDAGASLDFDGEHGEYLIDNAMSDDTKELLTRLTGRTETESLPEPPSVRLGKHDWAKAQSVLDELFKHLNSAGIVAEQDCGTTQEDALSDCAEIFRERRDRGEQVSGICFYTRQDLNRAKRSAQLNIGIWGADEGGINETVAIGNLVRNEAESLNLPVHWNARSDTRPTLLLSHFKE